MTSPSEQPRSNEAERVVEEAARWFALMQGGEPGSADREALRAWIAADPRHGRAYADMERLWKGMAGMPGLRDGHRTRMSRRRLAGLAAVAGLGAAGWLVHLRANAPDVSTGTGERRRLRLPDGSTADLAARTVLSLAFDDRRRTVVLHGGQAFFTVASEPGRPFVVEAAGGRTTALGTAFGIDCLGGETRVAVTHHAVEVTSGAVSLRLAAGSAVSYGGGGMGAAVPMDPDADLSWREGRLVFTEAPLARVVEALNRWRRGHIMVLGSGLAARPITMIADVERTDRIVAQLAQAVPMRVIEATPLLTVLVAADSLPGPSR